MIHGDRIRQVRELNNWTQTELARRIGVNQSAVAQFEASRVQPSLRVVRSIAQCTGFPVEYFSRPRLLDLPIGTLLFRARASVTASERRQAQQYAQTAFEVAEFLLERATSLEIQIPRISGTAPAEAARETRRCLGLSQDEPISHLINSLEHAGVLILGIPVKLERRDAYSCWVGGVAGRAVVVVPIGSPGDRLRFSVAHEVGHLVLHSTAMAAMNDLENEANQFASELLMPATALRHELELPVTLSSLSLLKPRWKVSVQALARRAYDLRIVTERQYRYLFEQASRLGWRTHEPESLNVPREKPRLVRRLAELIYGDPIDYAQFAAETNLAPDFLRDFIAVYSDSSGT